MIDRLLALIVDEGKWLSASMAVALFVVVVLCRRHRHRPSTTRVAAAMNLFAGTTIGAMAFGHLLAVSIKLALGTLRDGSLVVFYVIGIVLAVPAALVIRHTWHILTRDDAGQRTIVLNAWLSITLLALGLHNLPLAAPSLLTIAYQLHSRRAVGWAIVGLAVVMNVGLLVASLIFLASGQSFEQFRGIE
jgi:hypothetical protein